MGKQGDVIKKDMMIVGSVVLGKPEYERRPWLCVEERLARALRENERLRKEIKELKKKLEEK